MNILLNGEAYATDAKTLDELCTRLGFAEAKIATAVGFGEADFLRHFGLRWAGAVWGAFRHG